MTEFLRSDCSQLYIQYHILYYVFLIFSRQSSICVLKVYSTFTKYYFGYDLYLDSLKFAFDADIASQCFSDCVWKYYIGYSNCTVSRSTTDHEAFITFLNLSLEFIQIIGIDDYF